MPRISEIFFWTSMMVSAFFNFFAGCRFSRSKWATRSVKGFLGNGFRPRFLGLNAESKPFFCCLRQAVRFEEYSPSRRKRAPICPDSRHASASCRMRSLYLAVNLLRGFFSRTSGSGAGAPDGLRPPAGGAPSFECQLWVSNSAFS